MIAPPASMTALRRVSSPRLARPVCCIYVCEDGEALIGVGQLSAVSSVMELPACLRGNQRMSHPERDFYLIFYGTLGWEKMALARNSWRRGAPNTKRGFYPSFCGALGLEKMALARNSWMDTMNLMNEDEWCGLALVSPAMSVAVFFLF